MAQNTQHSSWQVDVTVDEWAAVLGLIRASRRNELIVFSSPPAAEGTPVDVSLSLPDNSQLSLSATVVASQPETAQHRDEEGFTLAFDEARPSDLVLLEAMASANCDIGPELVDLRQFNIVAEVVQRTPPHASTTDFRAPAPVEEIGYEDEADTVTSWPPPPRR